jgi:sirohydrochlorin cobaltochelatase
VIQDQYADATLILVGHGTTQNESSSATVLDHVAQLRQRGVFREVRAAFWKQDPQVETVLLETTSPRVFLVPFFISEGYFSDVVIPKALGFLDESGTLHRRLSVGAQLRFYTKPVGSHPAMTEVILTRAREVVKQFPFPRAPKAAETTLFIAGHGTEKHSKSRQAIDLQVERISSLGIFKAVHAVFMEEPPKIADCYQLATTHCLVVVPFFASDGLHVVEDIPVLLGEAAPVVRRRLEAGRPTWRNPTEKQGKLVWYSHSVGAEPSMANVILELVQEASAANA